MALHVKIDEAVCNGYGNCVFAAPDVFDLDPDTNIAQLRPGRPVESDTAMVDEAVADCPAQAISVRRQ